ncbi:MAG: response regulator [Hyphomicrobiales bacterium]|nr:response regulator [Hyphomicrobiales bacterium]
MWLVLVLSLLLIGTITAAVVLPHAQSIAFIDIFLLFLAFVGFISLFFYAVGVLQLAGQSVRFDYTRQIADRFVEGLLVTKGDSTIAYANETYMRWSGAHSLADIRTVERLFSSTPETSEAIYRLAQAAREGKIASEEVRLTPALSNAARIGWYRIRVAPLDPASPASSKKASTLWSVADITREREHHERVFQELQHAIDFLDHAPAGFFSADADKGVNYMNATLAQWLDYDLAQVGSGGLRLSDLIAGNGSALLASLTGNAGEEKTESFDVDLKRRNGQNLPVRLMHNITFDASRHAGSSRTLVLNRASGEDKGEDLRAAQVRFARFFNSTPMAIAALGKQGEIIRSNSAFAKLLPAALDTGLGGGIRSIYATLPQAEQPKFTHALSEALADKGDILPLDVTLTGEGNRSARLFLSPAEDNDGAAAILFALDTTEQRTLQESFAQSQKMQAIGQLAGGVAHDFNNVLTAIIGFSDLLLAQHRPTDPSFQDIMQIKQNANRAAGLVRQLLAFSRRQTLRPEVLQLGDLLSDLRVMLARMVGEKIELQFNQGRDLWLVRADHNQFEQVIINLVVNARDAMAGHGRITLRTRNVPASECASFGEKSLIAADYVAIEIEDNGHGIPADVREKIFEPFFTTKEVGKGTGLGLSMVYGIIKQTGGYVFCVSEPGQGALFRLLLPRHIPLANEVEVKKEAPAKATAAADLTGHGTVLLVEDEEAVRAFGARALKTRGYTVIEAESGADALEVVAQTREKIDLIVSDVVMPEMDGPTMLGELRKRGITAKVIFVSGYAEDAFAKNLPEGEAFGFLPKPFSLKQLVETVKHHIQSQD